MLRNRFSVFGVQCSVAAMIVTAMGCGAWEESEPAAGMQQAETESAATVVQVAVPVPTESVPLIYKPMDNSTTLYCAITSRIMIEKSITQLQVEASVQSNYQQLILDPRGNQWEATHVLIAPVIFTMPSGARNKQIWAIYCADNEVIHTEHCYFGNLPADPL